MVKSGLVDIPHVSQYRLTAHLGLAVLIYGFIIWTALELINKTSGQPPKLGNAAITLSALVFLMTLTGGLVAGTKAGYAYSTWPLMGDSFVPVGLYQMSPAWLSAFENITTIQFNHRMFAYLIAILMVGFSVVALRSNISRKVRVGIFRASSIQVHSSNFSFRKELFNFIFNLLRSEAMHFKAVATTGLAAA